MTAYGVGLVAAALVKQAAGLTNLPAYAQYTGAREGHVSRMTPDPLRGRNIGPGIQLEDEAGRPHRQNIAALLREFPRYAQQPRTAWTMTSEEGRRALGAVLPRYVRQVARDIPASPTFPTPLQSALVDGQYMGLLGASPVTRRHLQNRDFGRAANEYTNAATYRWAAEPTNRAGGAWRRILDARSAMLDATNASGVARAPVTNQEVAARPAVPARLR